MITLMQLHVCTCMYMNAQERSFMAFLPMYIVITTVSAPLNPMVVDFNYYRYNFIVAVEWRYPDSDPTPDVFTVLVSGSTTSTQTVPGNETSVALTLLYNVDYTVGITATLCGNTSVPAMTGKFSEG